MIGNVSLADQLAPAAHYRMAPGQLSLRGGQVGERGHPPESPRSLHSKVRNQVLAAVCAVASIESLSGTKLPPGGGQRQEETGQDGRPGQARGGGCRRRRGAGG